VSKIAQIPIYSSSWGITFDFISDGKSIIIIEHLGGSKIGACTLPGKINPESLRKQF